MTKRSEIERAELDAELDASLPAGERERYRPEGSGLYRVVVAGTSGEDVVVELGPRVQGVVPLAELDGTPAPGTVLEVALRGREGGLWAFSTHAARAIASWRDMEEGALVKGVVRGVVPGGLELDVGGGRAFLPASQVALSHVEDLEAQVGRTLVCEVLEIDRAKRSLVVSRRAVLEEERRRAREDTLQELAPGAVVRGRVRRLESYGAFVEIAPGVEGLLHVSNVAHRRIEHPEEVLSVGQELELQVLEVSEGGRRIGLGRKQLLADPWDTLADRLHVDDVLQGTVRRVTSFGAFVEVEPGVEGLVHVSQLGPGRVRSPQDALRPGEETAVRVLSVDVGARRLSLSRLDPRGALLGSEEAAESGEIESVLREESRPLGTNLGSLFRKAMRDRGDAS